MERCLWWVDENASSVRRKHEVNRKIDDRWGENGEIVLMPVIPIDAWYFKLIWQKKTLEFERKSWLKKK